MVFIGNQDSWRSSLEKIIVRRKCNFEFEPQKERGDNARVCKAAAINRM